MCVCTCPHKSACLTASGTQRHSQNSSCCHSCLAFLFCWCPMWQLEWGFKSATSLFMGVPHTQRLALGPELREQEACIPILPLSTTGQLWALEQSTGLPQPVSSVGDGRGERVPRIAPPCCKQGLVDRKTPGMRFIVALLPTWFLGNQKPVQLTSLPPSSPLRRHVCLVNWILDAVSHFLTGGRIPAFGAFIYLPNKQ